MRPVPPEENARSTPGGTWNDPERIAVHRQLDARERIRLAIEASRAALRFAHAERLSDDEP